MIRFIPAIYPEPKEIQPVDNSNYLLESFDQRWEEYRATLKTCRAEFSEPAVHDLRVSTRRLLAVLEIIQALDPQPRLRRLRRFLKNRLDGFDNLRDVQVMLASVSENSAAQPALAPYKKYLEKKEKRLFRAAGKQVRAIKTNRFNRRMSRVREALLVLRGMELPSKLLQLVDTAYQLVLERYALIDPANPASIHRVRVAFKKFRYTLECVYPVVPGFPESQFERMHAYQTLMGNIQDAQVFLQALAQYSHRHTELDLEPVRDLYEKYYEQALFTYLDNRQELHNFWRAVPKAAFPWNANPKIEAQL